MKSIRQQLILTLLLGLALLFAAASSALYFYTRDAFISQFDDSLRIKIASFAEMSEVEWKDTGPVVELDFHDLPLPEFQPSTDAEFYQVWLNDGTVQARSPSLNGRDLARLETDDEGTMIQDILMPDGRRGRAAASWFSPAKETVEEGGSIEEGGPVKRMFMVMARSREGLDNILLTLLLGYIVTGLLLISGSVFIVRWSVGRGLHPLDHIAQEAAGIESSNLAHRFPTEGLPPELEPICGRLNELLDRLELAFHRERRFNADIAHELRTPIAELRTLAEVALKKGQDGAYYDASRTCFRDVLDIASQMEKLVTTLLALVRSETSQQSVEKEDMDLTDLIRHACRPYQEAAERRNISFELQMPEKAGIRSDKTLLSAVLANLFSNAAVHTPEGGAIRCEVAVNEGRVLFRLRNTNDQLTEEDLGRLFEPLWKKDLSRTDSLSNGLGLSLVAAYAGLLGIELEPALVGKNLFEISFRL